MKLLKAIAKGFSTIIDVGIGILATVFTLMALSGMITFGCTKSFWTNQATCTMTAVFNTLR